MIDVFTHACIVLSSGAVDLLAGSLAKSTPRKSLVS